MTIDIIYLLIVAYCFYAGFNKGLVMAVLSLAGYIAAVFATMYFTQKFTVWLNWKSELAPIFSYIILFISVIILFRLTGKLIEGLLDLAQINFINKIAGGLVGCIIGTVIFSSVVWLLSQLSVLKPSIINQSMVAKNILPVGHFIIETLGGLMPSIKHWWIDLKLYLQQLAK